MILGEAAGKGRHEAFAAEHDTGDFGVACLCAAGQDWMLENTMKIRRRLFQSKVVVLVAVGASDLVKMLSLGLLRRQRPPGMTACNACGSGDADQQASSLEFSQYHRFPALNAIFSPAGIKHPQRHGVHLVLRVFDARGD